MGEGGRGERGQVTPALLVAVIGGFAIAVAFVSLQNLLDQSGRAATASDAAALAAGSGHRDALAEHLPGGTGVDLAALQQLLSGGAPPPLVVARAQQQARDYARANGADLASLTYDGFDAGERQWEYTALSRQRDSVAGGTSTARSESRSRAAVRITAGLCDAGLVIAGACRDFDLLERMCEQELEPEPEPEPAPAGAEGPGGPDDEQPAPAPPVLTPPPGLEGVGCLTGAEILGLLAPEVRLIS